MPAVNLGPSSTQTQNITAGLVNPANAAPASAGYLVAQSGLPLGIAPTGTMGANGAVTMGTALVSAATAYSSAYFFYPAGAVYAGSLAGLYFTKMSSTTAGIVYNNIFVPGTALPTFPSTLTLVSDPGPGAFTGVTTIQNMVQFNVPGNVMGPNGSLSIEFLFSWLNSAGSKTVGATWGGSAVLSGSATTTATSYGFRSVLNRGVTNNQVEFNSQTGIGLGNLANGLTLITIDSTQAQPFIFNLTLAAATDYVVLEAYRVIANYAP